MKKSNSEGFIGLIAAILIGAIFYVSTESSYKIPPYILVGIVLFTLAVKRIAWFKPYVISKYNILSGKVRYQQEFDFPKELLFDKLLEVMQEAGFKIIQTNRDTCDIFAITRPSWYVWWGENIYVNLKDVNGKTTVDFYSVSILRLYSYGKNERNYKKLLQEFEKSLTI
jgi:hypothetical protein